MDGMNMRERIDAKLADLPVYVEGNPSKGFNVMLAKVMRAAIVDAVLDVLRTPDEGMLNAAFDVPAKAVAGTYAPDGDIEIEEDGPRLIWTAMLDAARTPAKEG